MGQRKNVDFEVVMTQEANYIFLDLIRDEKPNRLFADRITGEVFYGTPYNHSIRVVDAKYVAIFIYHVFSCEFAKPYLPLFYKYLLKKCK